MLVLLCGTVFSHEKNDLEYAIFFGGGFEKALISLKINNKPVFDKYRFGFEKEGNLSLKQKEGGINIFYNGKEKQQSKIKVAYLVNLSLTVNGVSKDFTIDLRKGNILVFDFSSDKQNMGSKKIQSNKDRKR